MARGARPCGVPKRSKPVACVLRARSEAVWGPEAEQACGLKRSKPVACLLRAYIMSFRPKTRLLRFASLCERSPPAPSLSALGDLSFSGAAHRARQRPERGAGGRLSASRADAGRA